MGNKKTAQMRKPVLSGTSDKSVVLETIGFTKPEKLFKIGEVISHTGISRQTIHNYTVMGLINESKRTVSGHRLYDENVFEELAKIERLKRHHTLQEVKNLLKGG